MSWSKKYKKSIDCSNPKGFSQKAHCAGRKKRNENSMKLSELKEMVRQMVKEAGPSRGFNKLASIYQKEALKHQDMVKDQKRLAASFVAEKDPKKKEKAKKEILNHHQKVKAQEKKMKAAEYEMMNALDKEKIEFDESVINEWKLQLDLGKVNPSEFENWASDSLQKKHKIKVSGSGKNWTIVGKGNDDRMGSSADWITQLLGKAWRTNKIKVVQKESVNEGILQDREKQLKNLKQGSSASGGGYGTFKKTGRDTFVSPKGKKYNSSALIKLIGRFDDFKINEESVNEAKRSVVHKAVKGGNFPVTLVVIKNGKVIDQELVNTPMAVPAAFNVIQSKHKGATIHIEDKTGKRLFSENMNEGKEPQIITQLRDVMKSGYKTLKDPKSGKRMKVDSYTASAIVGVYDKLKPSTQEKFVKHGLLGMQSFAFKVLK